MSTYKRASLMLALFLVLLIMVFLSTGSPAVSSGAQDRNRPISLRGILSKLGEKDRMTFLRSMVVVRGKIASAYTRDLKRLLTRSEFEALQRALGWESALEGYRCSGQGECKVAAGYACEPEFCQGTTPGVSLGEVISSAPETSQAEFLNSLDFQEGFVISSNSNAIEQYATRSNVRRLPQVVPLKVSECIKLGGDIVTDDNCPFTSTAAEGGTGALKGKFRCKPRGGGDGMCIDESSSR
jgi:hypothetical protein